jgi:hypothetical protein
MAMIGKGQRMYIHEQKSVREIVRLTSLSRNTVRKCLRAPVLQEPRYRRANDREEAASQALGIEGGTADLSICRLG